MRRFTPIGPVCPAGIWKWVVQCGLDAYKRHLVRETMGDIIYNNACELYWYRFWRSVVGP